MLAIALSMLLQADVGSLPPSRGVRKPNCDFGVLYPESALRKAVEGYVVFECGVKPNGDAQACRTVEETPEGFGFGQAALKMAHCLQRRPAVAGDPPVDPSRVRMSVHFDMPQSARAVTANGRTATPAWLPWSLPSGETFYPPAAMAKGVGGGATVTCGIDASGALRDCKAFTEFPKGWGFGAEAVRMAGYLKMKPVSKEGLDLSGGTINIPLKFRPKEVSQ